jgi:hypothetical protein
MPPPGPLVYDVVFPINSSAHVRRPEEGDIGCVTIRIEVPAEKNLNWQAIEELAAPFARQRITNMVAPGGGLGPGTVAAVLTGNEKRPENARMIPECEGASVWEISVQRHRPQL